MSTYLSRFTIVHWFIRQGLLGFTVFIFKRVLVEKLNGYCHRLRIRFYPFNPTYEL